MSFTMFAKTLQRCVVRNRRSRHGISTIMANLMMLIIVVTLSSMLFIWAISSLGAYTGGAGSWFSSKSIANQERPSIETVFFAYTTSNCPGGYSYCATIYVRNVGTIPFTVSSIYINSSLYQQTGSPLPVNAVAGIYVGLSGQSLVKGDLQTVTVGTLRGTVVTTTWVS